MLQTMGEAKDFALPVVRGRSSKRRFSFGGMIVSGNVLISFVNITVLLCYDFLYVKTAAQSGRCEFGQS